MSTGASYAGPSSSQSTALKTQLKAAKVQRNRITNEGVSKLKEFSARYPDNIPPVEDRKDLLRQIRATPGNENYTMLKMMHWFRSWKARTSANAGPPSPQITSAPLPTGNTVISANESKQVVTSLTPEKLETLRLLSQATPDPSEDMLKTWATALSVALELVREWVNSKKSVIPLRIQLPTPMVSMSPELQPELKEEPVLSPVVGNSPVSESCSSSFVASSGILLGSGDEFRASIAQALSDSKSDSSFPNSSEEAHLELERYAELAKSLVAMLKRTGAQNADPHGSSAGD